MKTMISQFDSLDALPVARYRADLADAGSPAYFACVMHTAPAFLDGVKNMLCEPCGGHIGSELGNTVARLFGQR